MFGNPLFYVAFFTEVIHQAVTAKQNKKPIELYSFIAKFAGKRMGLPIDVNQLRCIVE